MYDISTVAREGRDREKVSLSICPSTRSASPARAADGHARSMAAPTMPVASGRAEVTSRRMVIAAVCQPLAPSPSKNVSRAPSASRW
ncbi:hypothetical protein [Amycolatopsis sp. NPDC051372]|uniref:hypothetical protein n=1 Tax=unclassified Amycolatopsis TaxID=2618356 RepID=UPI0034336A64